MAKVKSMRWCCPIVVCSFLPGVTSADIGLIGPTDAFQLIESKNAADQPIVLDTRGGYKDYFRSHLPKAHHLNFDTLRGTDRGVPVQYLPEELTRPLLVRAGVNKSKMHLIYATGETLPNDEILSASMVAYVLEKHGIENIRIIDGGLAGWQKARLPTTQEYFGNPPGHLPDSCKPGISATLDDVRTHCGKPNAVLVDARPKNEYLGDDDIWLRKGHIPGAISFHWARLMESDNTHAFKPTSVNSAELRSAGLTPDKDLIVYCGTSREGSLLRFYLAHVVKFPKVRLYEGSWKEYVHFKDLPAEKTENKTR